MGIKKQDHCPQKMELLELIKSYFPKLKDSDISGVAKYLGELSDEDLESVLDSSTSVLKGRKKMLIPYFEAASTIYDLVNKDEFQKWLTLVEKVSALSWSCAENFFRASIVILESDASFLEKWTNIGFLLAKKDYRMAAAYFANTSEIFTSTKPEIFEEWVEIGNEFAKSNVNVAKKYFECFSEIVSLLSPENFQIWSTVVKNILVADKNAAIEIIDGTNDVFSTIPPQQRITLLTSLNKFVDINVPASLALFNNAPLAIARLDHFDFKAWESAAAKIAKINGDVAVSFLSITPKLLDNLEMTELLEWTEKGSELLSVGGDGAKAFFEGSFQGLKNALPITSKEERAFLLDIGVQLTLLNWKCIDSYFENASDVLKHLTEEEFEEWVAIGTEITKESPIYGLSYYENSALALDIINPKYHETIFKNARSLLKRHWLLAGIYFGALPEVIENIHPREIGKWVATGIRVYDKNKDIAVAYFKHSPILLKDLDITELDEWASSGIDAFEKDPAHGMLYFSLKSKKSADFVKQLMGGVALKRVVKILKYYAMGISGINFTIRSKNLLPNGFNDGSISPVISGRNIYLAPTIRQYGDFEDNFRVYKLSIMHEVGHIQFGTSDHTFEDVSPLIGNITAEYNSSFPEGEQYSQEISVNNVKIPVEQSREDQKENLVDFSGIVSMFPNPLVAGDIMGVIEDARVEYKTTNFYKGLRRDFEEVRKQMLLAKQSPEGDLETFMEALLWLSVGCEPSFEIDDEFKASIDKARFLLGGRIFQPDSSTFDSLEVTFDIYKSLEGSFGSLKSKDYSFLHNFEYRGEGIGAVINRRSKGADSLERMLDRFIPENVACLDVEDTAEEELQVAPHYAMMKNWNVLESYRYDEWDAGVKDYRPDWCTVHEVEPVGESNEFYSAATERYTREIMMLRRIFRMLKPESFQKVKKQLDGDDIDIDAFTDALVEKRCGINPTDRLYIRRDKRERNVATLFLIDVSVSTQNELENGRSVLDIERDALIIMIQALESIGDKYAIYAFSGETRADVEYFVVKDFDEKLSEDVECRIGALEPVYNTRLGPAIRHSITKLKQVEATTKVMVLLSDGEPYDVGVGEVKYDGHFATEDTRMAIQEGKALGMHFFGITIDKEARDYIDAIFSDVGYTIIDNAVTLPERLPMLYKRITT